MELDLDTEVRPGQLQRELAEKLGREVRLSVRQPGEKDDEGNELPGVVVVLDAETGEPLAGKSADKQAVRKVLNAHTPKAAERAPSRDEQVVAALQAAESLEDVKAALIARFTPAERPVRPTRRAR
jgi:hypothetical protein